MFFLQISLFLSQDKQPSWKIRYTCHDDILYFSLKQAGEAIVIQIPVFHKTKRTKFGFLFPNQDRVGAGYSNVSKSWSNLKRWVKEFTPRPVTRVRRVGFLTSGLVGFGYWKNISGWVGYRVFLWNTKSIGFLNLERVFVEYLPYFLYFLISNIWFD